MLKLFGAGLLLAVASLIGFVFLSDAADPASATLPELSLAEADESSEDGPADNVATSAEAEEQEDDSEQTDRIERPEPRSADIVFTGDTLAHSGVVAQAKANAADAAADYDFRPMFSDVAGLIEAADVAICHLETPLSVTNTSLSGYPLFNVPRELAGDLAAVGYDGCTTASNHSVDRGPAGVKSTLDVLESAGLQQSGMARSGQEADDVTFYDAGGIRVANLSYTFSLNGLVEPADQPWLVNDLDVDQMIADARTAQTQGAEYVIMSIHWGTEYQHEPNAQQRDVASQIAEAGVADLIIGHHAHVVQPIEQIDDTWVVFGLGNFLSNQSANCCVDAAQDGLLLQVQITEQPKPTGIGERSNDSSTFETSFQPVPTRVDRSAFTIVRAGDAAADEERTAQERATFQRSTERTLSIITQG